jgi:hypothetical protein
MMSNTVSHLIKKLDHDGDAIHVLWLVLERSVQPVEGNDFDGSLPENKKFTSR